MDDTTNAERPSIVVSEFGDLKVTKLRSTQKQLSDDEIAEIIVDYQNGMSTYQLAEKFGCHRQTISKSLKKHGVNVTKSKVSSKLDEELVISLYENMHTSTQIAERFDVQPQVIVRCLHANNIPIRSRWDY
jgi:transposase